MAGSSYATASRRKILEYLKNSNDHTVTAADVEPGRGCEQHLHLKCVKCGKIIHLECHFMEEISHHIEESHGFTLQCKNSILYGICKECKPGDHENAE